jgi:hypothetical protein
MKYIIITFSLGQLAIVAFTAAQLFWPPLKDYFIPSWIYAIVGFGLPISCLGYFIARRSSSEPKRSRGIFVAFSGKLGTSFGCITVNSAARLGLALG